MTENSDNNNNNNNNNIPFNLATAKTAFFNINGQPTTINMGAQNAANSGASESNTDPKNTSNTGAALPEQPRIIINQGGAQPEQSKIFINQGGAQPEQSKIFINQGNGAQAEQPKIVINQGGAAPKGKAMPISAINLGGGGGLGMGGPMMPFKPPPPPSFEFNCKNNIYFEAPKKLNWVYYSVLALFILFMAWAYFSQIEEITRGDGKVIPSSHVKTIQSLDGGIISKFYVKEGDLVQKGQVLIQLDDTRFSSDYNQSYTQLITLIAEIARLKAQLDFSLSITFPKELDNYPNVKLEQVKLFKGINDSYQSELSSLEKDLHLCEQELNIILPLVNQGLMSQLERIRLEKQLAESKGKISNLIEGFKTKAQADLADKENSKVSLEEKLKGLEDRRAHTKIVSPIDGYIHNFKFNTIGGVIKPGVDVLEIVPLEEQLIIEAKVNPRDRAFIRESQFSVIKFPAYDSSIYGGLDAKVISISPDTEMDEKRNEFYIVRLETDKNYLLDNEKLKIIPGMTANVSILTGKKRILFYILKPVTRIKEFALRER